ncbi:MAG: hypothetical protein AAFV31_07240 [Pseudomonadota bacterium]
MTKKLPTAAGERAEVQDALGAISWDKRMADARARRAKILAAKGPQQPVANDRAGPPLADNTPEGDPALTDAPPEWMTDGLRARDTSPVIAPAVPHAPEPQPKRFEEEDPFAAPRRARRVAIIGYVAGAFAFGIIAGLGMLMIARMQEPGATVASLSPQPVVEAPTLPAAIAVGESNAAPQSDAGQPGVSAITPTLGTPTAVESAALGEIGDTALPPADAGLSAVAPETEAQIPALTAALAASIPQLAPSAADGVPVALLASRSALPADALFPQALAAPSLPVSLPQEYVTAPPSRDVWAPRGLALALEREFQVILTATAAMSENRFNGYVEAAEATGLPLAASQRVGFAITRDQVRFFHADDITAAGTLADALSAELRDFTGFSPKPPAGTLEVYLSNSTDAPPVIDSPTAEIDRLRDRLLNSLQRGDHL